MELGEGGRVKAGGISNNPWVDALGEQGAGDLEGALCFSLTEAALHRWIATIGYHTDLTSQPNTC
ncbi:MAG: hypothetical protein LBU31_03960 [Coriobacteriales bacterium]|nr:hypothetical protein [Coriobacteriales bacterium]